MTGLPVAVAAGDGFVVVGPVGAVYLARALTAVERQHRAAGIRPPAEWVTLRDAVDRAASFARESAKARSLPDRAESFLPGGEDRIRVGAEQVAELLRVSPQWARTLLRRGSFTTARRCGSVWTVDEAEVVAWLLQRGSEAA